MHRDREAEAVRVERIERSLIRGDREQLTEGGDGREQRERAQGGRRRANDCDRNRRRAEADGAGHECTCA